MLEIWFQFSIQFGLTRAPFWDHFGPSWGHNGASWDHVRAFLGPSWLILGHLGPILSLSWGILNHLGAILGPSWSILAHPGPSWAHLAPILNQFRVHLGAILWPSWAYFWLKLPSWTYVAHRWAHVALSLGNFTVASIIYGFLIRFGASFDQTFIIVEIQNHGNFYIDLFEI